MLELCDDILASLLLLSEHVEVTKVWLCMAQTELGWPGLCIHLFLAVCLLYGQLYLGEHNPSSDEEQFLQVLDYIRFCSKVHTYVGISIGTYICGYIDTYVGMYVDTSIGTCGYVYGYIICVWMHIWEMYAREREALYFKVRPCLD